MNRVLSLNTSWQSIFWPKENTLIKQTILVFAGVLVLAIAAQLSIPMQPIPLTIQSATVIMIGMAYGPRYGTYTVSAYLVAGACGLPVFAGLANGFTAFFGPTAGYILGFLPAVFISGILAQRGWTRNSVMSFATACIGATVIFSSGVAVLASFVGWPHAVEAGILPFMLSEPIKLLAVACLATRCWKKTV